MIGALALSGIGIGFKNVRADTEMQFVGTAVEYHEAVKPGGTSYWRVQVEEVLSGPQPCTDRIKVVTFQAINIEWGDIDPTIEPGDKVEVYGKYRKNQECNVILATDRGTSNSYCIKKIETPAPITTTATPTRTPKSPHKMICYIAAGVFVVLLLTIYFGRMK